MPPYIDQNEREELKDLTKVIDEFLIDNPGELNYLITTLLVNYLTTKKESYKTYNDLIGVLECAKLELYSRMVIPYERKKCSLNGDVYPKEKK